MAAAYKKKAKEVLIALCEQRGLDWTDKTKKELVHALLEDDAKKQCDMEPELGSKTEPEDQGVDNVTEPEDPSRYIFLNPKNPLVMMSMAELIEEAQLRGFSCHNKTRREIIEHLDWEEESPIHPFSEYRMMVLIPGYTMSLMERLDYLEESFEYAQEEVSFRGGLHTPFWLDQCRRVADERQHLQQLLSQAGSVIAQPIGVAHEEKVPLPATDNMEYATEILHPEAPFNLLGEADDASSILPDAAQNLLLEEADFKEDIIVEKTISGGKMEVPEDIPTNVLVVTDLGWLNSQYVPANVVPTISNSVTPCDSAQVVWDNAEPANDVTLCKEPELFCNHFASGAVRVKCDDEKLIRASVNSGNYDDLREEPEVPGCDKERECLIGPTAYNEDNVNNSIVLESKPVFTLTSCHGIGTADIVIADVGINTGVDNMLTRNGTDDNVINSVVLEKDNVSTQVMCSEDAVPGNWEGGQSEDVYSVPEPAAYRAIEHVGETHSPDQREVASDSNSYFVAGTCSSNVHHSDLHLSSDHSSEFSIETGGSVASPHSLSQPSNGLEEIDEGPILPATLHPQIDESKGEGSVLLCRPQDKKCIGCPTDREGCNWGVGQSRSRYSAVPALRGSHLEVQYQEFLAIFPSGFHLEDMRIRDKVHTVTGLVHENVMQAQTSQKQWYDSPARMIERNFHNNRLKAHNDSESQLAAITVDPGGN